MAIRNIVTEGDPILRKKCREVGEVTDRIKMTMEDMLETMHEQGGVGIAAPQVGVMRRMFIAEPEPERVYFMINPVMLEQSGCQADDEGCLSVPGMLGDVTRPKEVIVEALDVNGKKIRIKAQDLLAIVLCHEIDHLDGVLFIDKATELFDNVEED